MKKITFYIIALLGLLAAAPACTKQEYKEAQSQIIDFSVSIPELKFKAVGDESSVTHLHYEVYEIKEDVIQDSPVIDEFVAFNSGSQSISVSLELVLYQHYKIIFWADHADEDGKSLHYATEDLREISFKEGAAVLCNDASREAYYSTIQVDNITELTAADTKISLQRPFAQLNIGDSSTAEIISSSVSISGLANTFDTLSGEGGSATDITFSDYPLIAGESISADGISYKLAAMCYAFVPQGEAKANVSYSLKLQDESITTHSVQMVPFKNNHRSNIVGKQIISQ